MRVARVVLGVVTLALGVSACSDTRSMSSSTPAPQASAPSPSASTQAAAARFLARYVTSDGRVIRHDQGGDIVSEGQAYAMLLAELARRGPLVRTIWSWTSAHLRRGDGLFAWHANGDGQLLNEQSASDADILIAYALLRYRGADQAKLNDAGRAVAQAVLANESVTQPDGAPLVVAGPWAKLTSRPIVDPSYLMPSIFVALGRLTGDQRWSRAAAAAITTIAELTDGGRRLPPDWARLSRGRLVPIAEPGGAAGVQYGFDAARLPVWFATACESSARALAAGWWRNVLGTGGRSGPQALGLSGNTIDPVSSPLPLVAGAAAAAAAGDAAAASDLRKRAGELSLRTPTYYGDAWVALGPALLERSIDPCAE